MIKDLRVTTLDYMIKEGFYIQEFTSSGTFYRPKKFASTWAIILALGGGGGGGGGYSTNIGKGGSAGGWLECLMLLTVDSYTVTVGAAGTAGAYGSVSPGGAGGNTSFGSIISAGGGSGGLSGYGGTNPIGGAMTTLVHSTPRNTFSTQIGLHGAQGLSMDNGIYDTDELGYSDGFCLAADTYLKGSRYHTFSGNRNYAGHPGLLGNGAAQGSSGSPAGSAAAANSGAGGGGGYNATGGNGGAGGSGYCAVGYWI